MDPADHFPPSYSVSRERLLDGLHRLSPRHGLLLDSRALDVRGPDGGTLALDFAILGARRPRHALVLSCGTHGVEGYVGAAIQHHVIEQVLPRLRLAPDTAVVLQHANNPYGFAWGRRVNESNVDFNRNFLERFDPTLCDPDYERLHDALNPADLDPAAERARWDAIEAFVAAHGARRFQQVALGASRARCTCSRWWPSTWPARRPCTGSTSTPAWARSATARWSPAHPPTATATAIRSRSSPAG
jgi:hypothetical protein